MRNFFNTKNTFENPFFIGTVEDNNDPTFNYRVKVRIEHLHPSLISTEQLPWAARVDSAFMGIGDTSDLKHGIPEVGNQVLVLAVGNDPNSLVYLGCLYKKTTLTPSDNTYLNSYGIYRADGQFIGIDKVQKLFKMLFDGDVNIDLVKEMTINVSNNVTITCQNATVKATKATIDAPDTEMTGNLKVAGNIETDGSISAAGDVKSDGEVSAKSGSVTLTKHVHPYTWTDPAGAGTTGTGTG